MKKEKTQKQLLRENEKLQLRLQEAKEALQAMRAGAVHADVVRKTGGKQASTVAEQQEELQVQQEELQAQNEELRQIQEQLEESREQYLELFDFAPVGYFILDKKGFVAEANLTGAALLGIEKRNLLKKPLSRYVNRDDSDDFYLHLQKVFKDGERAECELRLAQKDNAQIYVHLRSEPVKDETGIVIQSRTAVIDITKRKQAEQALRRTEEQFRRAIQEAPIPIIMHAEDGEVLQLSRTWTELTGYRIEDIRTFDEWTSAAVYGDGAGAVRDYMKELFGSSSSSSSSSSSKEFTVFTKTGQTRYWILNASALGTLSDGRRFMVGMATDITERKAAEEQLRQINQAIERSNADLQQFAYVASHDLREPLRAINGFMDLLRRRYKDTLDAKANEYIDYAASGAKRMDELLTGLLAYSRVQTQGKPRAPVSAKAAFNAAVENLRAEIDESNAAISSDPLPSVNADGMQFTQLLQNLLHNALKFRTDQRPEIHVGCQRQDNSWLFCVRDNGIGIEPQFHERIFTIFHRVNPQDKRSGYGVGLSICKRIVERHNGRIWVESEPGKGSSFYFTVPD